MFPILIEIGPLTLYTYGLLAASGFLAGIALTAWYGKKVGIDPQVSYDTGFWIIVSAVIGGRLLYGIVNFSHFSEHPLDIFKVWEGGLVFYGGLIGAMVGVFFCARKYGFNVLDFADSATPGLALGHGIGRIGCFFAGCCYGEETDVPWSVTFSNVHSIAPTGIPLHPTQLYSMANEFTVFVILVILWRFRKFRGQIWLMWIMLYAVTRSIIEVYRGDGGARGMYYDGLISTSQIIAAIIFSVAVWFYFRNRSRNKI